MHSEFSQLDGLVDSDTTFGKAAHGLCTQLVHKREKCGSMRYEKREVHTKKAQVSPGLTRSALDVLVPEHAVYK